MTDPGSRTVICADAMDWLATRGNLGAVITSLPDADEMGQTLWSWSGWFRKAVERCVISASVGSPAIFYQTDRKAEGLTFSKAAAIFEAARSVGAALLWHKIVLRRDPGKVDVMRPGYCHLIAVGVRCTSGRASADVLPPDKPIYPNAMSLPATLAAVRFVMRSTKQIVDPFCGRGTVLAVAQALGCAAVGVDIDPEQCEQARSLVIDLPNEERRLAGAALA